MQTVRVARLKTEAKLPVYGSEEAAGMDISTCVDGTIEPGQQVCIPTGLAFQIPKGYVGILKERSGLSFKNKLALGAGVIDSDYRGEVKVILRNHSDVPFTHQQGDRVSQMLILKADQVLIEEVSKDELNQTQRGEGGFGSTGVQSIAPEASNKRKREETDEETRVKCAKIEEPEERLAEEAAKVE